MSPIVQEVVVWLNSVVIGLNLCPFSAKPVRENRVRFYVSEARTDEDVLADVFLEMELLDRTSVNELETTLVIIPYALNDFFDYRQCLAWAQAQLKRRGWLGVYQLASFHPDYCFASAEPEDAENLTNRSPYPIIHIIREASLEKALSFFDDVEGVPERNKETVAALTMAQQKQLFPYLFR